LATLDGVSQARFDVARRRVLFTRFGAGGLWSVDDSLTAASVQQLSADRPSRWRYRTWSLAGNGSIDYVDDWTGCSTGLQRLAAGAEPLARCVDMGRLSSGNGFSTSVDGNDLYVALAVSDGADIGVMPLPDSAGEVFPAFIKPLILKD